MVLVTESTKTYTELTSNNLNKVSANSRSVIMLLWLIACHQTARPFRMASLTDKQHTGGLVSIA